MNLLLQTSQKIKPVNLIEDNNINNHNKHNNHNGNNNINIMKNNNTYHQFGNIVCDYGKRDVVLNQDFIVDLS